MTKLLPINQFFNAAGEPLNGGLVYTYVTQSSTPKATYTDQSAATEHPNPVVLSAGGRAEIWLATDMAYKLVIKDSSGTQIGSAINDVVPVTTFASFAGGTDIDVTGYDIITTGGDDIRLTPDGSGKVKIGGDYYLPNTAPASGEVLTGTSGGNTTWSTPSAVVLDSISNVNAPTPSNGDLLKYVTASSEWQNAAQSTLSITASQVSDLGSAAVAFTNKTGNISQWTNDSSYATASSTTTFTNKSGNISQWTNDSGYNTATAASQANMEAASSNTVYVTPGRLHNHPAMPKAVVVFKRNNGSDPTIEHSFNVTSVTRSSGTAYTITLTSAMANATYGILHRAEGSSNTTSVSTLTTTTFLFTCATSDTVSQDRITVAVYGDQ